MKTMKLIQLENIDNWKYKGVLKVLNGLLSKEILINKAEEAKSIKSNIYIIKIDSNIYITVGKSGFSEDFLKDNNLNYDENLIIGLTPNEILKEDHGIYNHWETNIKNIINSINKDYRNYNLNN